MSVIGSVCIASRGTAFIGKDLSHQFGQTLELRNGMFLQTSPTDLICRVQVTEFEENGKAAKIYHQEFPSSLFSQARIQTTNGEAIYYKNKGIAYELLMVPTCRTKGAGIRSTSFDECMKTIQIASQSLGTDYYSLVDIPDDNAVIYRNNIFYSLSPETKQIQLGQVGVSPFVFEELKLVDCSSSETMVLSKHENENELKLTIWAPENPFIEILLDKQHLFVSMQSTDPDCICLNRFYHQIIQNGSRAIDEEKITAFFHDGCNLTITFPYAGIPEVTSEVAQAFPVALETTASHMTGIEHSLPICVEEITSIEACIDMDIGFGRFLGIRTDSNWEETIPFNWSPSGWVGQIPVGKHFKFVKVSSKGAVEWEQRHEGNRILKESSQDRLVLTRKDVRF